MECFIDLIDSGLGNQFFQYAAAYSMAKKRNSDTYICLYGSNATLNATVSSYSAKKRKYMLNQFNVPQDKLRFGKPHCDIISYWDGKKVDNYSVTNSNVLDKDLPDDKVLLLADYFESEVFFADYKADILNLFQPTFDTRPIDDLMRMISSTENSVSVHIRRGDFSNKKDFRLISLSYQREAMQLIKQKLQTNNLTFFVFTDDLDYVKSHLGTGDDAPNNIIYMSDYTGDNTLYDFVLMTLCKHNIIPNSTFGWWAAYLNRNPDKIVVAPLPKYSPEWFDKFCPSNYGNLLNSELAYPKGWLTIEPEFLKYSDRR